MLRINTNLLQLNLQSSLANSTNILNQSIERMTTGFKINGAKDNVANYAIATSMESKLSSLDIASDNVAMGKDLADTATDSLDLVTNHLQRIRDLMEMASNGTYGENSRLALQAEIDSRLSEINRIVNNCDFNGIRLFSAGILPSSAEVKLTDLGMNTGTIGVNKNGVNTNVNITSDDTLFSVMKKLEFAGIKSSFDNSTGTFTAEFNAEDVTDIGTGFLDILGLTNTDGYRAENLKEDIEQTEVLTAQLSTRLDACGITNGNFTIVDPFGIETNDSISVTSTIQQLFDKLYTNYGISGTLDEAGIISLSTDGNYIKGALANQLGINYQETYNNATTGVSTTSSNSLVKSVTNNATGSNTMSQLGISIGDTLEIRNNDGEIIWSKTADNTFLDSTLNSVLNTLKSNGMTTVVINDGVISLTSSANNYVTGTIAEKFGIGVNTSGNVTTNAVSQTSSSAVTFNTTQIAQSTNTFSEMGISTSGATSVYDSSGNLLGSFNVTNSSTLGNFLGSINALTTNGNAAVNDGVISIESGYVTGNIANSFGLTVNDDSTTATVAKTQTSASAITYTSTVIADGTTTFAELGISTTGAVSVYDVNGALKGTFNMTQSSTLNDFISSINSTNTSAGASLTNGVISIDSGYITGAIAGAMEIDYELTGSTTINASRFAQEVNQVTTFSGTTYVRSGVTYQVVGTAADLQTQLSANNNVILSDDIDLTGVNWTIVNGYNKNFDGNGHVISNLSINTDVKYAAFLGSVSSSATISNIGFDNVSILSAYRKTNYTDHVYCGVITAYGGNISNCFVSNANIKNENCGLGNSVIGGISGDYSNILSCNVYNIYFDSEDYESEMITIGGIAGGALSLQDCNVFNAEFNGSYSSSFDAFFGGIIGGGWSACHIVRRCNVYNINIYSQDCAGGIYGGNCFYNDIVLDHCNVYDSTIISNGTTCAGGLIGGQIPIEAFGVLLMDCNVKAKVQDGAGNLIGSCGGACYEGGDEPYYRTIEVTNCTVDLSMTETTDIIGYSDGSTIIGNAIIGTVETPASIITQATGSTTVNAYSATDSTILSGNTTSSITNSTTLGQLGIDSAKTFTMNGGSTVTIGVNDSIVSKLQSAGLEVSISSGQITITGDSSYYITSMDSTLASALKIQAGENYTWQEQVTPSYSSSDSNVLNASTTQSITNSTTLGDLGFDSAKTFVTNNSNTVTIGVNDSIVSKLQSAGLGVSINNGKLTITGDSSHLLTGMDSELKSALKIQVGENHSYTITGDVTHSNTNSDTQSVTTTTTLSTANSNALYMSDFGLTSNGTITTNNHVVTVNTTDLMSEVLTKLNNAGIVTAINDSNGTLTLTGSAENYITQVSNNLKNLLGLNVGEGYTYNTSTITTRSDSASQAQNYTNTYTIQQTATENTLLSKFDTGTYSTSGNLVFMTNEGLATINITSTDTIKSFQNKLGDAGITSNFSDGQLTISGNNGSFSMLDYGPKTTSRIADLMGLTYNSKLDSYCMSSDLNVLADTKYEESLNIPANLIINAGVNGNESDMITIDTQLQLGRVKFDVSSSEEAQNGLSKVDNILQKVVSKQQDYAAFSNRLDSASESILISIENLTSSLSTIRDVDIAEVSSQYLKSQILQHAAAMLLATANQTPSIALGLI